MNPRKRKAVTRRDFLKMAAGASASVLLRPRRAFGQGSKGNWIVFITIDTLRADHLRCYGYPRVTAPFLESLAEQNILFRGCYAATSQTSPSHLSLFSGLEVPQHKLFNNMAKSFDPRIVTLPQFFRRHGYRTGAFVSVRFIESLNRDWDTFNRPEVDFDLGEYHYRQADETIEAALGWVREQDPKADLFLWVHLFDPHDPYRPPEELLEANAFRDRAARDVMLEHWLHVQKKNLHCWPLLGSVDKFVSIQNAYDAEIAYADRALSRLWDEVERCRGAGAATWYITADHGEGLGNHDYMGHGMLIYREQLSVPLLIRFPDGEYAPVQLNTTAKHIDLFHTVIEHAGLDPDSAGQVAPLQGQSLMPLLKPHASTLLAPAFFAYRAHRAPGVAHNADWPEDSVYTVEQWPCKYIRKEHDDDEAYDVARDPLELNNRISDAGARELRLRDHAETYFRQLVEGAQSVGVSQMTEEHQEELRTLGYL